MNIFKKSKLKIKNESTNDRAKFCIGYYNLEESINFKMRLFKEIIGDALCLVIIDTSLSYNQTQIDKENSITELINLLDTINIEYKKLMVKPVQNSSGLSGIIKLNNNSKKRDYIIGFVVSSKNIKSLESIVNCNNTHYYIDSPELTKEDLLTEVETYYYSEDEMYSKFNYNIFDCSSIKNMVLYSNAENEQLVNNIISTITKDFQ